MSSPSAKTNKIVVALGFPFAVPPFSDNLFSYRQPAIIITDDVNQQFNI